MTQESQDLPKLLKARQLHSRVFAVIAIIMLLVSEPLWEADSLMRQVMLWGGYVLVMVGAFGRVYASAFIGGRKNEAVVRSGPFSVVRNPLYVFSFLATIGIGMQSGMWVFAVMLVTAFIVYYPFVVAKEENFLRTKFGDAYDVYVKEVPRWIPDFSRWNEPEESACMPKFIRRTIGDAMIFFLPMPAFALIATLQAHGVVPVFLKLL